MAERTLTMLDTSGIQKYIFNSNRLQENIGASELVYRATTLWAFEVLPEPHNVQLQGIHWEIEEGDIGREDSSLRAQVVYAGGGNTLILFKNLDDARAFTSRITRRLLDKAPGLQMLASHLSFEVDSVSLADVRSQLIRQLADHKQSRLPSVPFLGLGVSAACESTGLPAVGTNKDLRAGENEEIRLISRETRAKLLARDKGNRRLNHEFGAEIREYRFPHDIDKLGRIQGEESYVAVVHVDGNRMGERLGEALREAGDNRERIRRLLRFSTAVNEASRQALKRVVRSLVASIEVDENGVPRVAGKIPLVDDNLPFRPLVFGGDDVTFLCNGQLGISLAVQYLKAFEEETERVELGEMSASAGVSIVKMHYPFARAYALSEQLLSSAKRFAQSQAGYRSALDWHFATGGLSGSLGVIRDREYLGGRLLMRPLLLHKEEEAHGRYWEDGVEELIRLFRETEPWKFSHNKVVGLRDVLRDEKGEQLRAYLRDYELPPLPRLIEGEPQHSGWSQDRCVYFDAVELLDHYIGLDVEKDREEARA